MPYPQKTRNKSPWLVVIKTKPRSRVDNQYMLKVAYQEESMSSVVPYGKRMYPIEIYEMMLETMKILMWIFL